MEHGTCSFVQNSKHTVLTDVDQLHLYQLGNMTAMAHTFIKQ